MTTHTEHPGTQANRRKFERVEIDLSAHVAVLDPKGKRAGILRQLGRGGFGMEPETSYSQDNKVYEFVIHEQQEDIVVRVKARILYVEPRFVGFQFVDLDVNSAVEVGIIIGKYYEAKHKKG